MVPYTHWNLALVAVWLSLRRGGAGATLGAVAWCNSWAIVASYESVRILNANAYAGFVQTLRPWREDVLAHWVPIVLLWKDERPQRTVRLRHACAALALQLVWVVSTGFDLSVPYPRVSPPLTPYESVLIWVCGFLGCVAPLKPRLAWWVPYGAWIAAVLRQAAIQGY